MKRLIHNWISYIALMIVTLLFTIYFRQSFFVVLFLLLCFLPAISFFMCKYAFSKITIILSSKTHMADKPAVIPLKLTIVNDTFIPLSHFELTFHISSCFYPKKQLEKLVLPAYAKKHSTSLFPISYKKAGCYQTKLLEVAAYDFLGLFYFSRPYSQQTEVHIMPAAVGEIPYHTSIYGEGFDEYEENSLKGNISSNVTDVREYRPGDRLQKIHWKLTAKSDNLMVKENEATTSNRFFLLVELYSPISHSGTQLPSFSKDLQKEFGKEEEADFLDRAMDYTFMLGKELLLAGESFFLSCYSVKKQDFPTFFIRNSEDFYQALTQIFYESTYPEENLGKTIYERSKLNQGTLLHITHKGVQDALS